MIVRHGLRNALLPVLGLVGLRIGGLLAGTVLVESVFAVPGVGRMMVDAVVARDFPMVQGGVLVVATMVGGGERRHRLTAPCARSEGAARDRRGWRFFAPRHPGRGGGGGARGGGAGGDDRAVDRAVRSAGGEPRRQLPAELVAAPARHRPSRPRHVEPPGGRRERVAGHRLVGTGTGLLIGASSAWSRRGGAARSSWRSSRCVDVLLALPELLLAITAITVLGRGTVSTMVAVADLRRAVLRPHRPRRGAADRRRRLRDSRRGRPGASDCACMLAQHVLPAVPSPMLAHATVMLGSGDSAGVGAVVPRSRRAAARGRMGIDAQPRPRAAADGAARRRGARRGNHR